MYKYFLLSKNKSVFNWTFCQLLPLKTQLHETMTAERVILLQECSLLILFPVRSSKTVWLSKIKIAGELSIRWALTEIPPYDFFLTSPFLFNELVLPPSFLQHEGFFRVYKVYGEGDIYGRKPRGCLGRDFNFKLSSLTDNTINSVNANGHF